MRRFLRLIPVLGVMLFVAASGGLFAYADGPEWVRGYPEQSGPDCVLYLAQWSDGALTSTPWRCDSAVNAAGVKAGRGYAEAGSEGCVWYVTSWQDGSFTKVPFSCPAGVVAFRPGGETVDGPQLTQRITEQQLKNARYTICGEKLRIAQAWRLAEADPASYARICKPEYIGMAFAELSGDSRVDVAALLYLNERSHRIPSVHLMVDVDGRPVEAYSEILSQWDGSDVSIVSVENGEVTLKAEGGLLQDRIGWYTVRLH